MRLCDNCGASVDDRWKFCLHCGARMSAAPAGAYAIPGAIRPQPATVEHVTADHVGKRKLRFDWQLALGVILAAAGIAMIVYLVVVLVAPHG